MITVESLRIREALWAELTEQVLDFYQLGSYDQVVEAAQMAIQIAESIYDLHHVNLSTSLSNLTTLLLAMDRAQEADSLFRRAMDIDEAFVREGRTSYTVASA